MQARHSRRPNIVIPDLDHRELAFYPSAFAEMYKFITGMPATATR